MTGPIRSFRADFQQLLKTGGDRAAIIDPVHDRTITYGDLARLIGRLTALFQSMGLGPDSTVLVMLPNAPETLLLFLAAAQNGLGWAPITNDATPREVERWTGLVRPTHALVADGTAQPILDVLAATGVAVRTIPLDGKFAWAPVDPRWNSLAPGVSGRLYLTTSGSTGEPSALVMDTDVLWSSGKAWVTAHRFLDEGARFLNILPMSYLGGLFNLGLIPLASGGSVVIGEAFSGRSFLEFWSMVERFDVTVLWLVPTIMRGLLSLAKRIRRSEVANTPKQVRACFLGTAPVELEIKTSFEAVFGIPVLENFALSETTFFTSETLDSRNLRHEGSVGGPLPWAELRFVPYRGEESEEGEAPTEILVRTPYLFLGYLREGGLIERQLDQDGFFATGDLGRIDAQNQLSITGRRRDIIKKGGYFVSLREVEALACRHPAVEEAAAVGVRHAVYGEDFILNVRLVPGMGDKLTEFGSWLRANLVKYKWPERIVEVDDFPRTASGKIRKHLLVKQESKR